MAKEELVKLKEDKNGGYELWLDEKKLNHVESYKIESSPLGNKAELSIKMLVRYP